LVLGSRCDIAFERNAHKKSTSVKLVYDCGVSSWNEQVIERTVSALAPLANPSYAPSMRAYMKDVAPYLGIRTPDRRSALRAGWRDLTSPTSDELGATCLQLMNLSEREYHYAASDLLGRFVQRADERFLVEYVQDLLTIKSWWDTVDSLGSVAVSPLCYRYDARALVLRWSRSRNFWLNRAAIQHQRGWGHDTDVSFVLELCHAHATSTEFFVVKAIGWALRDISRLDARSVRRFLEHHPSLGTVAVREAQRGLSRL
jgi:3-methyladenine DNA glycosylase AlkD